MVALPSAALLGLAVGWWAAARRQRAAAGGARPVPARRGAARGRWPPAWCVIVALVAAAVGLADLARVPAAGRLDAARRGAARRRAGAVAARRRRSAWACGWPSHGRCGRRHRRGHGQPRPRSCCCCWGWRRRCTRLENDPGTIGKNYQLTSHSGGAGAAADPAAAGRGRRRAALLRRRWPTRSSWARRSTWSPTAATACGSRIRRCRPAGGPPARARPRSARAWPRRWAWGRARRWPRSSADGDEARFRVVGVVRDARQRRARRLRPAGRARSAGSGGGQTVIQLKDGADQAAGHGRPQPDRHPRRRRWAG